MKTIVTIWYVLMSFDGVEMIEGPTPEEITVFHTSTSTDEDIIALAEMVFDMETDPVRCRRVGEPSLSVRMSMEVCRFPGKYEICPNCHVNSECTVGDQI